jgi:hypothetical protein
MVTNYDYHKLYQERLPIGQEFQDFCALQISKNLNIPLVNFSSKEYQFKIGENLQGFEIKYDRCFENTGNLWIEISQRITPDQDYYSSGIFKEDNAWMYCIGNYSIIYIFSKKHLCLMSNCGKWQIHENKLRTSKGFLISREDAERYSANKIVAS